VPTVLHLRRATAFIGISRSMFYYKSRRRDDSAQRARICEIAKTLARYGVQRIHMLLRREGWLINHKKTYRICREGGLNLRSRRPRRRVSAAHRLERVEVHRVNHVWSMDFVADNLFNNRSAMLLSTRYLARIKGI
jgi:putative transposase